MSYNAEPSVSWFADNSFRLAIGVKLTSKLCFSITSWQNMKSFLFIFQISHLFFSIKFSFWWKCRIASVGCTREAKKVPKQWSSLQNFSQIRLLSSHLRYIVLKRYWMLIFKGDSFFFIREINHMQEFQDEGQVAEWKRKFDSDVETLKAKSNALNIRSVSSWFFGTINQSFCRTFLFLWLSSFAVSLDISKLSYLRTLKVVGISNICVMWEDLVFL